LILPVAGEFLKIHSLILYFFALDFVTGEEHILRNIKKSFQEHWAMLKSSFVILLCWQPPFYNSFIFLLRNYYFFFASNFIPNKHQHRLIFMCEKNTMLCLDTLVYVAAVIVVRRIYVKCDIKKERILSLDCLCTSDVIFLH
jgi:hypothetical protein